MPAIFLERRPVYVNGVIPTGSSHAYLVYREDDYGQDIVAEWVISAFPINDSIDAIGFNPYRVETNRNIIGSDEDRGGLSPGDRHAILLPFSEENVDDAWNSMCAYARLIDLYNIDYFIASRNSNTFISALLYSVGLNPLSIANPTSSPELLAWENFLEIISIVSPPSSGNVLGTGGGIFFPGFKLPSRYMDLTVVIILMVVVATTRSSAGVTVIVTR